MSNIVEIKLNGKTFKLGYGMEVFLQLGELWGFDTLEQVNEQFQILQNMGGANGTSLKNMKIVSEILEAMISGSPENGERIKAIDIRQLPLVEFQNAIVELTNGFVKNMPQQEPEEISFEKKPKTRKRK
ncbi:hypothetical protein [Flavobacterium sp. UGB4466]|uniref:hypothetical protein n=1 Tax=Flavobacterium sp. UGB4466 TaxID=2730889 RepID=UPI00192B81B2|nr:hypothetical protein [Flavobacterium sp. UGB4466]